MIIGKKDGVVHFQNSQRVYQKEVPEVSLFKSSESIYSSIILNIELDSTYVRQLALAFNPNSTVDEDHAMDARKMDGANDDISWSISEEDFVINIRPKIDEELIPLRIKLTKGTSLRFSVAEFDNFNPDRMFIYDAKENLYFGIKTGYLKMNLPEGDYQDRFFISFIEKLPSENPKTDILVAEESTGKLPIILLNTIEIFQNNQLEQLEIKLLYDTELSNLQLL